MILVTGRLESNDINAILKAGDINITFFIKTRRRKTQNKSRLLIITYSKVGF